MWLAFNYVAVAVMLAEANFAATNLNLSTKLPILEKDLRVRFVSPPEGFTIAGRLDSDDYSFSFPRDGRLQFIYKLSKSGVAAVSALGSSPARAGATIITNAARAAAATYLQAVSVNPAQIEKTNSVEIRQRVLFDPAGRSRGLLPIFDVKWGDWRQPKAQVCIDGRDGSLLFLRLQDPALSSRPKDLIRDRDQLLAIPDHEFLSYSAAQRDALVLRFGAITYTTRGRPKPKG